MNSDDMTPVRSEITIPEIEFRPEGKPRFRNGDPWCSWVPYVKQHAVAAVLDEWAGPDWQVFYEPGEIAGRPTLWCHIEVLVDGQWRRRSDVGVPSNFEAAKGAVTDAFKRCATRQWGALRDIYDVPTLSAPCRTYESKDKNGNPKTMIGGPASDTAQVLQRELARHGYQAEKVDVVGEDGTGDTDEDQWRQERAERPAAEAAPDGQGAPSSPQPELARQGSDLASEPLTVLMSKIGTAFTKNAVAELRDGGMWPLAKVAGSDLEADARAVIGRYLEAGQAAAA